MSSERRPSAASSRGAGAGGGNSASPWDNTAPLDYDDLYDMYGRRASGRSRGAGVGGAGRGPGDFISEEEDYVSNDEPDFEMMSRSNGGQRRGSRQRRSAPDIRKIRIKVHAEDTRYVMIGTAVEFADFIAQIRQKFGMRQNFKVKIKDEGDMITMADQDDLDMAISQAKTDARKERADMGKMEVRTSVYISGFAD
jgi:hypothetical protein